MLPDILTALKATIEYADEQGIEIPIDMLIRARQVGAIKAGGDMAAVNAKYHDDITQALLAYFESDGSITAPRNLFKRATVTAFLDAFELGWLEGGQDLPPDSDALGWYNARVEQEFGFIEMVFQQAKELRKEEDFDFFAWTTARADGYTNTLRELYNAAYTRASKDVMVSFVGDDGAESCDTCRELKGQRHRISWFVRRNYVPPFGTGLQCHPGGHCHHYLQDDKGRVITQ